MMSLGGRTDTCTDRKVDLSKVLDASADLSASYLMHCGETMSISKKDTRLTIAVPPSGAHVHSAPGQDY
jgi:hypothetical protein